MCKFKHASVHLSVHLNILKHWEIDKGAGLEWNGVGFYPVCCELMPGTGLRLIGKKKRHGKESGQKETGEESRQETKEKE